MANGLKVFLGVVLGLVLCLAQRPAWADKPVEPLVFGGDSGAIAMISLYETDPVTQAEAVKSFYKLTKAFYKTIPGFYGLALLASDDGERVVEISQWLDRASYEAFQASLTATASPQYNYTQYYDQYASAKGDAAAAAVSLGDPAMTAAFAIEQVLTPPGMVAAIPGALALVQLSDLGADTPDQQATLLRTTEAILDGLPDLYPAPRMVVVLNGLDSPQVVLMAHWGSAAEFSDRSQIPLLALAAPAVDSRLYQAVKVITPKPKTYGKG
jgi:heme-degrading monooxygenase HmoA